MLDLQQMMRRQQVLADFGEFALRSENLDEVLTEACRLVGEALGTGRAKILEIQEDGQCLFVRAGVGWDPEVVGHVRLPLSEHSSETFSIREGKPTVTQDISTEERFEVPQFMKEAGVVALVNVPIFLPGMTAYGLLQVDATEVREFGQEDVAFLRTYATILGPVIDRLHKARDLRSTEERFRLIVESTRDYAIFLSDAEDRITDWLPGAEAVFGWTPEQAEGQSSSILFTPEDRSAGEDAKEVETARREGLAPNVRWHLHKDGSRVFIEGSVTALHDPDGQVRAFLKIGQDVTERRRTDEQLREVEARQRALIEGVPQLVWRAVNGGQWTWSSPQWSAYTGQSEEKSHGLGWLAPIHADDRERVMAAWDEAQRGGALKVEHRIGNNGDGGYRWFATRAVPARDENGEITEWLGTSTDIDDLRQLQEQQAVYVAELQHRTRNLLGVVRSIAQQTMAQTGPTDRFSEQFNDRLSALSRVQGLLSRSELEPITIGALVHTELDALGAMVLPNRVVTSGPKINLRKAAVQTIALALHELATNARKYGALSTETGRLSVTWRTHKTDAGQYRLVLDWVEEGISGPNSEQSGPTRLGYGRRLIEQALPYALDAQTRYELGAEALRCSIDMPLPERIRKEER